ncbi:MAG: ParB N-terminal domain-containing protein [Deltaproteobacteria bacterium]|nr:ParB N-terminal domain-containing protein [Deltaproteobacteria bacterium]MBW1736048.1 ParB N-terminal domain-containing protein [Deltaproteobacteria bacterium]MBW1908475.1 ParB N-terminal domain-containing protein [Deltaproteobacteria bacterium]MBW2032547.1 ParB N-terminal domain-containing protein [Deltaproteobacteria bacterium]MBW2167931.1 ParB N-terminal domain-containing protein [Deltaproteobacteria bacterium]
MSEKFFRWEGQSIEEIIGKTIFIPVENINPDPKNLRETFELQEIIALGQNIQEIGQMDTIRVFPKIAEDGGWHGEFDLHDGERRWRAANSVGLTYLRALVEEKPSEEEITFKRISRVLQTESLKPEEKVRALEKTFDDLGILYKPEEWEKYRDKLGASKERFAEIVRVIKLPNRLRELMFSGAMSYTIAQAVGRLPKSRQEDAAKFVLANKLYGRYVVTEFIPYLLDHPEASYAQAFDHTKVGGWRQYTKRPSKAELKPDYEKVVDDFLKSCVQWERAWDKLVATGVVKEIKGKKLSPYRLKDGVMRVRELAERLLIELFDAGGGIMSLSPNETKLLESNTFRKKKSTQDL